MCGGFVEDIGNAVSDVVSGAGDLLAQVDPGQALGDVVESIGNVVEPAIQGIGGAVEDVGRGISDVGVSVDKAVNQLPGGWALPAAVATYFAAPYAAPFLGEALGAEAAAGALGAEAALTPAEILASGGFVPVEGASFALPAFESVATAAAPVASSVAEGATVAKAATDTAAAAKAAAEAVAGAKSTGETLGLLSNPIIKSALTGSGYGALTGGVTSLLTGQDALKGALIGGATGGILGGGEAALFPEVAKWAAGSVPNAGILGAGRGAAGGVLNTLIGGGDLKKNIMYGGLGGGILGAGSEYFFPTAATPTAKTSPGTFGEYVPDPYSQYKGVDTMTPEMLYGANRYDPSYDIARAKTQDFFDASSDPNRYWTNTEIADSVKALDKYKLTPEQIRLSLEQEGMYPEAARMAADMSGKSSSEIARKLELNFGEKIGPAGDIGIEMYKYTDTPLEEQYVNQDLQEGYVSAYREPSTTPSNWYSGLGNLGAMLGAKALGGLGGGGAAAKPMGASGSYVPKGMVDYAGILNLLAPKTSTRASLLG